MQAGPKLLYRTEPEAEVPPNWALKRSRGATKAFADYGDAAAAWLLPVASGQTRFRRDHWSGTYVVVCGELAARAGAGQVPDGGIPVPGADHPGGLSASRRSKRRTTPTSSTGTK